MLKKDPRLSHQAVQLGFFNKRMEIHVSDIRDRGSRLCFRLEFKESVWEEISHAQNEQPVLLGSPPERPGKQLWFFQNEFYWDDEALESESVRALILAQRLRQTRKIEKARTIVSSAGAVQTEEATSREPIPRDVQIHVWQRDQGRCTQCGSNQKLEFDHIIPLSAGGSNTTRNLQLLCETCNRAKGPLSEDRMGVEIKTQVPRIGGFGGWGGECMG